MTAAPEVRGNVSALGVGLLRTKWNGLSGGQKAEGAKWK